MDCPRRGPHRRVIYSQRRGSRPVRQLLAQGCCARQHPDTGTRGLTPALPRRLMRAAISGRSLQMECQAVGRVRETAGRAPSRLTGWLDKGATGR